MRLILNVIWLVLCGFWMAHRLRVGRPGLFVLIITIPFGIAAFRIAAGYVLWPFGRTIDRRAERRNGSSGIGNVIWIILFGWWLAIGHLGDRRSRSA